MELKNTRKWAKDKPKLIASISTSLISRIDYIHSIVHYIRNSRQFAKAFEINDIKRRTEYYKKIDMSEFINVLILISQSDNKLISEKEKQFIYLFNKKLANNDFNLDDQKLLDTFDDIYLDNSFQKNDINHYQNIIQQWNNFLKQYPIFAFNFKVLIPCIFINKTLPQILYERAINGDTEAFEKLAKIDNTIVEIPELTNTWLKISNNPKSPDFKRVSKILSNNTMPYISVTQIKYSVAAFIYVFSDIFGYHLSRNKIRELFDSYAKDIHKTMFDEDLPYEEKSFSIGINREIKRWKAVHKLFTQLPNQ